MSDIDSGPPIASLPERAALSAPVVASPQPVCTVCGRPRGPLKVETCSDRCRAALSRQRKDQARRARDLEIRGLLVQADRLLAAARSKLERA